MKKTLSIYLVLFIIFYWFAPLLSQTHKIDSIQINKTDYYPLYKILNILKLERYYDIYTRKLLIKDRGRYLTFFMDEDIVYYERKTILLKTPPVRHNGIMYIPQEMVDMVTHWKRGDYLFAYTEKDIKIDKKQEILYADSVVKPNIKSHRPIRPEPVIKKPIQPSKIIASKNTQKKPKIKTSSSKLKKFTEPKAKSSSANRIKVIVLDPGHGGKDPGAIGQKGLREKEVVLKTCLYLKEYLNNNTRNVKIIMTRDTDKFISLEQRAKIANKYIDKNTAGLFLSVHANASYNKKTKGTETFVLSPVASDDEARAVAAMENGFIRKTKKTDPLSKILTGMISYENIRESIQMSKFIEESYRKTLKTRSTTPSGVKKALFYVLEGTLMPAALTEIGFLTNKEEEKNLRSSWYKKKVAKAIGDGLIKFINWYNANNGFIQ